MPKWVCFWLTNDVAFICNSTYSVLLDNFAVKAYQSPPAFVYHNALAKSWRGGGSLVALGRTAFVSIGAFVIGCDAGYYILVVDALFCHVYHVYQVAFDTVDFVQATSSRVWVVIFRWDEVNTGAPNASGSAFECLAFCSENWFVHTHTVNFQNQE